MSKQQEIKRGFAISSRSVQHLTGVYVWCVVIASMGFVVACLFARG